MEEVKRLRKERGWSQQRLADEANINKVTLIRIEHGVGNPGIDTLEKLAKALDIEIADFFPKAQVPLWPEAPVERRGAAYEQMSPEELRQSQAQLNTALEMADVQKMLKDMQKELEHLAELAADGTDEEQQEAKARLLKVHEVLSAAA